MASPSSLPNILSRILRRQAPTTAVTSPSKIPIRTAQTQVSSSPATPFHGHHPSTTPTKGQINDLISQLPLVQSLRRDPAYKETRPHLTMPATLRPAHFVAGSLAGAGKVTVAPYMFSSSSSSSSSLSQQRTDSEPGRRTSRVVSIFHIGTQMCGHPGFVHGGLLSVMFDEAFARCVSQSFPSGLGMTANLNVNYRKPASPDRVYVLRAETVKVEGRKAWVEGTLTSLPKRSEDIVRAEASGKDGSNRGQCEEPVLVAEASALFVEPKFAESMVSVYRD